MNKREHIKIILNEMISIINSCDDSNHLKQLEFLLVNIDKDYEDCIYKMRTLFGGMGSLNDVILYKNGIILQQENDDLHSLKNELFNLCFLRQNT